MAAKTEPRNGLNYGWGFGETGWNVGTDANWLKLGLFGMHLSVLTRAQATPPSSPVLGASYIVPSGATGAWASLAGRVAVWSGTEWVTTTPRTGWVAYIEDEEVLCVYKSSAWSTGVAL